MMEIELSEDRVMIGNQIVGVITAPLNKSCLPAVLLFHGFGSHKDEVGGLYKRLAIVLAAKGYASFRFDFRGWGESEGDMSDTTIHQQVNDAQIAHGYLTSLNFVDSERIGVVGFSLGGAVAIISAVQNRIRYKSMVVWSSVGNLKTDFSNSLGQDNFGLANREGIVQIDLGWRFVRLKKAFFESLEDYDLQYELSRYKGAFLAIAGGADSSAKYVERYIANARGELKEAMIIPGADHVFNVFDDNGGFGNRVIDKTVAWFNKTC